MSQDTNTKQSIVALVSGLLFAVGLALSGMTLPSKVIGFFDFSRGLQSWDPSLAFVMMGGMLVYIPVWQVMKRRGTPLFDSKFHFSQLSTIDRRLVFGAVLFGIGWGLGGFCPGPAIASVGALSSQALVMVGGMLLGMVLSQQVDKRLSKQ
jgi:uncharacterized membrane protein YedE/YeeE